MARTPFSAEWIQAGNDIFQWGKKAAYWKGAKGWWASRQGDEGIQGPFRTPGAAQKWAEEPFREQHRRAQEKAREAALRTQEALKERKAAQKARAEAEAQAQEARDLVTWKGLPADQRRLQPGQVWAMRDPKLAQHQILVVEVKKRNATVLVRQAPAKTWKGMPQEVRTLDHVPRVYRLVGKAALPSDAKK